MINEEQIHDELLEFVSNKDHLKKSDLVKILGGDMYESLSPNIISALKRLTPIEVLDFKKVYQKLFIPLGTAEELVQHKHVHSKFPAVAVLVLFAGIITYLLDPLIVNSSFMQNSSFFQEFQFLIPIMKIAFFIVIAGIMILAKKALLAAFKNSHQEPAIVDEIETNDKLAIKIYKQVKAKKLDKLQEINEIIGS